MTKATVSVTEFQPPSIQNYSRSNPGFAHRFVDKNKGNRRGDRLSYWINQGWEIAPYGNEGMKGNRDTGASSDDHAVHYRGLVLMRIPIERARARNEFYRGKHTRLLNASAAMRELAGKSQHINAETRRKLTSAFAQAHIEKGGKVLEDSSSDSTRRGGDPDKLLRDVDMSAVREMNERMASLQEEQKKLKAENDRMREELLERTRRPSDRKRKSFPVS